MKIFLNRIPLSSNSYSSSNIFASLTPLQKKIALLALIVFSCAAAMVYGVKRFCHFNAQKLPSDYFKKNVQEKAQKKLKQNSSIQEKNSALRPETFITPCMPKKEKSIVVRQVFQEKEELKNKEKNDLNVVDDIWEGRGDSIANSIEIVEDLAKRLTNKKGLYPEDGCHVRINTALKTLFKAAIEKQLNQKNLQRIIDVLQIFEKEQVEFLLQKDLPFLSLAMCFLNYLTQKIPEEIKRLPYWHHESLILAALNENVDRAIPFSKIIINLACNAVAEKMEEGFYYFLRPSTKYFASSSESSVFSMTFVQECDLMPGSVWHLRIETVKDPKTQKWLFREFDTNKEAVTIEEFIKKCAGDLPLFPILAPKTSIERKITYLIDGKGE